MSEEMEFLQIAQEAARRAGDILERWAEKFTVTEKGPSNLVTEADFAAQEAIFDLIHARYPEHDFLGEEGRARPIVGSPLRWIVDPLDGTTNYVHRFPFYAVSIALERDGELIAGVIYDPNRDEMFAALRGEGATLNARPIRPSTIDTLERALVVASLPVAVRGDEPAVQRYLRVMPRAQSAQRTGSAALNLAYVAAGRVDAFWSSSLKPWDMAAGALIVAEAGGRVAKMDGSPLDLSVPDILASNGTALHGELEELLSGAVD